MTSTERGTGEDIDTAFDGSLDRGWLDRAGDRARRTIRIGALLTWGLVGLSAPFTAHAQSFGRQPTLGADPLEPTPASFGTTLSPDGEIYLHSPSATLGPRGELWLRTPGATFGPGGELYLHTPDATLGPRGRTWIHTPDTTLGPGGETYLHGPGATSGPDGATWLHSPSAAEVDAPRLPFVWGVSERE